MEDKYLTMTAEELASDASFLQWAIHKDPSGPWDRFNNDPSQRSKVEAALRLVRTIYSQELPVLDANDKDALWQKIRQHAEITTTVRKVKRHPLLPWGLTAAAALALLIWFNTTQPTRIHALTAHQFEVILPESSSVYMNAQSSISYKKDFEEARTLHLKGEAFFSVKPGSTFEVVTPNGTVTVLGTSFNVVSRDDVFEISCYTGKVRVSDESGNQKEITQGQLARVENERLTTSEFAVADKPSWIDGKFTFDNQPLSEVTEELSRQYNVQVKLDPEIEDLRYTGLFEKGNLDTALFMITWPLHLEYQTKGKTILITR